jgi:hypothetical protein
VPTERRLETSRRASMNEGPQNNKMQQTRSGHSRWRPSLLILGWSQVNDATSRP